MTKPSWRRAGFISFDCNQSESCARPVSIHSLPQLTLNTLQCGLHKSCLTGGVAIARQARPQCCRHYCGALPAAAACPCRMASWNATASVSLLGSSLYASKKACAAASQSSRLRAAAASRYQACRPVDCEHSHLVNVTLCEDKRDRNEAAAHSDTRPWWDAPYHFSAQRHCELRTPSSRCETSASNAT